MTQKSIKSFLLADASVLEETKEIKFPQFDESFVIRSLTADEFDNITKRSTRRMKQNGSIVKEVDQNKLVDTLVAEAVVTPDLNDAELQEYYGTIGNAAGTARKMLKAGQWGDLIKDVQDLSGFDQEPLDELVDEVKK
ncbi:phage portal protein [Leuconostoc gelidum subsp. gasicomitatum]|uniref:phage tail assembly chaperone n=1 Tax=Leuconostoc gasicomitatum TaxID=115778 RepID=UPI001CC3B0B2|nr:phage portal protein [Leuconostoc gasicomitatum]MBZ5952915.1 phage portal protein [Leuconostoc gasicomitatum]